MIITKSKYKIIKDKRVTGQNFATYTVEKKITSENGKKETTYCTFINDRNNINQIDFDKLYFAKPITYNEWLELSLEYRKKWL